MHKSSELGQLSGKTILDIGFGDGRDMKLFLDLGMKVHGVEIDEEVVEHTRSKFKNQIPASDLILGTNAKTGFAGKHFDFITAFSTLFYLQNAETTIENVLTHVRDLLHPDGMLFCTLARRGTHALEGATRLDSRTYVLKDPYYNFRNGQRYVAFNSSEEVVSSFNESGMTVTGIFNYEADWFGSLERLFLVKAVRSN